MTSITPQIKASQDASPTAVAAAATRAAAPAGGVIPDTQHDAPAASGAADKTAQEAKGQAKEADDDHMSFWDFVDIINPLQHIPIVSTIYREVTGDTIKAPAKLAGALLYGGVIGLALAAGDEVLEQETGEDFGTHVLATLGLHDGGPQGGGGQGNGGKVGIVTVADAAEPPPQAAAAPPSLPPAPVSPVQRLALDGGPQGLSGPGQMPTVFPNLMAVSAVDARAGQRPATGEIGQDPGPQGASPQAPQRGLTGPMAPATVPPALARMIGGGAGPHMGMPGMGPGASVPLPGMPGGMPTGVPIGGLPGGVQMSGAPASASRLAAYSREAAASGQDSRHSLARYRAHPNLRTPDMARLRVPPPFMQAAARARQDNPLPAEMTMTHAPGDLPAAPTAPPGPVSSGAAPQSGGTVSASPGTRPTAAATARGVGAYRAAGGAAGGAVEMASQGPQGGTQQGAQNGMPQAAPVAPPNAGMPIVTKDNFAEVMMANLAKYQQMQAQPGAAR